MTQYAELEIGLHQRQPGCYAVELRYSHPDMESSHRSDAGSIQFALDDLLASAHKPDEYGAQIGRSLLGNEAVRTALAQARTAAAALGDPLRLRLFVGASAPGLHSLRWETLRLPGAESPLLTGENIVFSRYLSSDEWPTPDKRPRGSLRALVVVADPANISGYTVNQKPLAALDVPGELARVRAALSGIEIRELASRGESTLEKIGAALRDGYDILYLVCHGQLVNEKPWLFLEDSSGNTARIAGSDLVARLGELRRRPRLVVLASCQSAGEGDQRQSQDDGALAALGPRLAQAGIPAVVAMQGNISLKTVETFMPTFFGELMRDGEIDRAMSVARGDVRERLDWWMPVLFMRLESGQIWNPQQLRPRVIYLSHAVAPGDSGSEALAATRSLLRRNGFDVKESTLSPTPNDQWSLRILEGLGACDAAVLLLNERALAEPDNWVQVEARILCWRQWLQPDFQLIPIFLGTEQLPQAQQAPWTLLGEDGAAPLVWKTPEALETELQARLDPLQRETERPPWRLSNLQQRVLAHMKLDPEMNLDQVLRSAAQALQAEYSLPISPEERKDPKLWWARASLCKGPIVLSRLYDSLINLVTPRVRESVKNLLGPVQPAWVDIAAAAQLVHLTLHADQTPGTFYLRGTGAPAPGLGRAPLDWIARCYAARACGVAFDVLDTSGPLLIVVPLLKNVTSEMFSQIRAILQTRLAEADPDLWGQASMDAGVTVPDPWAELLGEDETSSSGETGSGCIDSVIKRCIEMRAAAKKPVLLFLPGPAATNQSLLSQIRQHFGPVGFFFMGRDAAPSTLIPGPNLASELSIATADQAYQGWQKLHGSVSTNHR
jgi:hypothetical protein